MNANRRKKPAHLAMQTCLRRTGQGGENSRLMAGLHDGGSARAHNRSVLSQQRPAHQGADGHRREHKQQDGKNGVHASVLDVEWVLNLAPPVTHHAGNPVEAPADVGEQQHSGLRVGKGRAPAVAGQWKSYQPTHERGTHGKTRLRHCAVCTNHGGKRCNAEKGVRGHHGVFPHVAKFASSADDASASACAFRSDAAPSRAVASNSTRPSGKARSTRALTATPRWKSSSSTMPHLLLRGGAANWCPPAAKGQCGHHNCIAFERGEHGKAFESGSHRAPPISSRKPGFSGWQTGGFASRSDRTASLNRSSLATRLVNSRCDAAMARSEHPSGFKDATSSSSRIRLRSKGDACRVDANRSANCALSSPMAGLLGRLGGLGADQVRHEKIGALHLDCWRNASRFPVVDTLGAANLVIPEQLCHTGGATKRFDDLIVFHPAIKHRVDFNVNTVFVNGTFSWRTMAPWQSL